MFLIFLFLSYFRNEEGEELYYKRGSEFKLPYPCLYDFEASFGGALGGYTESSASSNNKSFSSETSSSKPQPQSTSQTIQKSSAKTSIPATISAPTSSTSGIKTKSSKHNKAQLIQQRAQAHAQQQLSMQQLQQNYQNYQLNDNQLPSNPASAQNQTGYKFNSSYMTNQAHQPQSSQNLDYYSHPICKTELVDDPIYDSKSGLITNQSTSDYSSLPSSSSVSSTSSVSSSSSSSSSESITINVSNQNYHHYNYFNGLNQSYNYSLNDSNKFYSASSYSNSLFSYPNSNSSHGYNHYNHHYLNTQLPSNTENQNSMLLSTNLHSNNSSCSSNSSASSSSSSSSCSANNSSVGNTNGGENGAYNNSVGLATVAGVLWPESMVTNHDNEYNHHMHHLGHSYPNSDQHFQVNIQPGAVYNDILNCANNAAAIAAAKYSCAAAASTYCPYPFSVDEYQSPVSQIQL